MSVVISTINLKGGVGKTQMTVAIAEFLALDYGKRVLVIDLDPQTNATVTLMSQERWEEKNNNGETLFQLFKDKLDNTVLFQTDRAIERRVSNVQGGIENLSLLPSSVDLIEIQDKLPSIPSGHFFVGSPVTVLKEAIENYITNYDYVFIDCPPNLGIITLNGILISDFYLIPTIPDILSTYGIPQILKRIEQFAIISKIGIKPLGIVISMFRAQSRLHSSQMDVMRTKASKGAYPRILNTKVPLATKVAEAADVEQEPNTLKQKYGYTGMYETYQNLTQEIMSYAKI